MTDKQPDKPVNPWNARTRAVYISPALAGKLDFIAQLQERSCSDEYVELVMTEHITATYPNLDAVFAKANKAKKAVLEDAKAELSIESEPSQPRISDEALP